eukprot:TRINITY_DN17742_c0_g1_i1.p1 TRINITY_DN17742_c0_g1~~TRINITY_DN17742_c0_g1_i1.p1  ORF type:complete len:349 (-),score=51.73 TRINITY_DN17742_c0_g1_i1:15-1061(-)
MAQSHDFPLLDDLDLSFSLSFEGVAFSFGNIGQDDAGPASSPPSWFGVSPSLSDHEGSVGWGNTDEPEHSTDQASPASPLPCHHEIGCPREPEHNVLPAHEISQYVPRETASHDIVSSTLGADDGDHPPTPACINITVPYTYFYPPAGAVTTGLAAYTFDGAATTIYEVTGTVTASDGSVVTTGLATSISDGATAASPDATPSPALCPTCLHAPLDCIKIPQPPPRKNKRRGTSMLNDEDKQIVLCVKRACDDAQSRGTFIAPIKARYQGQRVVNDYRVDVCKAITSCKHPRCQAQLDIARAGNPKKSTRPNLDPLIVCAVACMKKDCPKVRAAHELYYGPVPEHLIK